MDKIRNLPNYNTYSIELMNAVVKEDQNTIHPQDDRVFSVRELMRFMSIPQDFQWTDKTLNELNKLNECEKQNFIKQNDINIRQSIGEAVPTVIFNQIAKNIKKYIG